MHYQTLCKRGITRVNMSVIIIMSVLILLSGCGNQEELNNNSTDISDTLFVDVQATIGVSIGDTNYVFGEIAAVREGSSGEIFVLDRARMKILEYAADGSFIKSISRDGSGPGELLNPIDFDIDSEGNFLILDIMRGSLFKLSDSGEYISTVVSFQGFPPLMFELSSDSSYIPLIVEEEISEGGEFFISTVIADVQFNSDELVEHWRLLSPVDLTAIENLYYSSILSVVYDVDSSGSVYYATTSFNQYHLISKDPLGNVRFEVKLEVDQVMKTEIELYEEQEYVKCLAGWFGGSIQYDFHPPPYRAVITDIDVDSHDRIWVRNGLETEPTFDVYSNSGEYLATVVLQIPEECCHLKCDFEIGESINGFPVNPYDYHRVFRFGSVDIVI